MLSTNTAARHNTRATALQPRVALRPLGQLARLIIGVALLVASGIGAFLFVNGGGPGVHNPPELEGTWELASLSGTMPGEAHLSGVLWQRVAFRGGAVRGETLVRSDFGVAGQKLPFPDESANKVVPNADGSGVRVLWSGTYEVDKDQITLHIGKAIYFVRITWREGGEKLELNQDVILTYSGYATYGRANTAHVSRTAAMPPLAPK